MNSTESVKATRVKGGVNIYIPQEERKSLRIFFFEGYKPSRELIKLIEKEGGRFKIVQEGFSREEKIGVTPEAEKNLHISTREFANLLNSRGKRALRQLDLLEENSIMADVVVLKSSDVLRLYQGGRGTLAVLTEALKKLNLGFSDCVTEDLLVLANEARIDILK